MISIAMATYNGAKYICEQMDSILAQTFQDFEIIVCDDCSTDETCAILQNYAKKDSRIHVFRNAQNLGFKGNFEKAMQQCRGEFVALCDQDDVWEKDHLETLHNLIKTNDIACGDAHLINSEGLSMGKNLGESEFFYNLPSNFRKIPLRILYNSGCFQGASMLIRRTLLEKALPLPEGADYHDTWLTLIASYSNGFIYTPQIITRHRRHDKNASRSTRWPVYLGFIHFKRNPKRPDRLLMASSLKERLAGSLSKEQVRELDHIAIYYSNRNSKFGKLKNLIFRTLHYSSIYTTRSKVFIEW